MTIQDSGALSYAPPVKLTYHARAQRAVRARLAREDWSAMTARANASPRNVNNMERWRTAAREQNPALNDEQVDRLAEMLRSEYYAGLARRSAATRRERAAAARRERSAA